MFETLRIRLWGSVPCAKINNKTLERIINREFGNGATEVKQKLQKITNNGRENKNRISAAIVKLANKDIAAIDNFVEISNSDYRDVLSPAEYPRFNELGFVGIKGMAKNKKKEIIISDWKHYSKWLNRK